MKLVYWNLVPERVSENGKCCRRYKCVVVIYYTHRYDCASEYVILVTVLTCVKCKLQPGTVSPGLGPFSPVLCRKPFFPGGAGCQHFSTAFIYLLQGLSLGQQPLMDWMTCSTLRVASWGCWVPIVPAPSLCVVSMLKYKLGGPHVTTPQAPPTTKLLECGALREKLATVLTHPKSPGPEGA